MASQLLTREQGQRRVQPGAVRPPETEVRPSTLLWSPTVVGRYGTAVVGGFLLLITSWFLIGGKADWDDQRPWMSLSIAAVTLVNFSGMALLMAGRRRVGVRRLALLGELPLVPEASAAAAPAGTPSTGSASSEELVSADGLLRYHRADCQLASGKGYAAAPLADHRDSGRLPCGVCLP